MLVKLKNYVQKRMVTELSFGRGMLMWATLLLGYFLFVTAWFSAGNTAGNGTAASGGWQNFFFGGPVDTVVNEAVNYGITFFRGIGSFLVGWAVVKITHRYTSLVAMILLAMAIPSVAIGYAVGGTAGFVIFIIFRAMLAVGGTTLIVLLQPVAAKSIKNPTTKGIISTINPYGFNTAFILMAALFTDSSVARTLRENWFVFSLVFALLTLIPLTIYVFTGKNFTTSKPVDAKDKGPKITMMSVLKEKNTWKWVAVYSVWLVAAVIPILGGLNNPAFFGSTKTTGISQGSVVSAQWLALGGNLTNNTLTSIWSILFVGGVYVGSLTIGRWNKTSFKRKPFMVLVTALMVFFFIMSIISLAYIHWSVYLIFGFLFGVLLWGIQGVLLNSPHEAPQNTPEKVGLFFGVIWGMGYIVFTLVNVVLALIVDVSPIAYFVVLVLIIALLPILLMFVDETKPEGALYPSKKRKAAKLA
ncbi:MFS transporter [Mycoplasma testudineum]|uniref:MFS transporter n=1 Tax=Mycoplasma testudineum TaxID=244584 RepID=A0A4R6IG38_9MOLU|nr:hexose phosphate transporter [Mycoplasma testudineum]OYD26770.1 MFS transporter [Mycoplasma testudineum]TDO19905.1 MFS transporter [Mycoplasma testudineum]